MARGNDAQAAAAELHGQYGNHQNAEDLIAAAAANQNRAVSRVALLPVDPDETAKLDLDKIKVADGHTVQAAAVRGKMISYVAMGPDGRPYKGIAPLSGNPADMPAETAGDATARADATARTRMASEGQRLNAEMEAKLEEERVKLQEESAKEMLKIEEQARKDAQKIVEQAQKEAQKIRRGGGSKDPDPTGSATAGANDPADSSGAKTRGSQGEKTG